MQLLLKQSLTSGDMLGDEPIENEVEGEVVTDDREIMDDVGSDMASNSDKLDADKAALAGRVDS
jgi:hypothetical protein